MSDALEIRIRLGGRRKPISASTFRLACSACEDRETLLARSLRGCAKVVIGFVRRIARRAQYVVAKIQ